MNIAGFDGNLIGNASIDEIIAATERETKDKIRQIPDGVYYGEKSIDHDAINRDKPVTVRAKVIKQGDEVKYSIKNVKAHIYGETALTTFYWNVEIKKGKKRIAVNGRASHVYIMIDDWKIVHEHYSKTH